MIEHLLPFYECVLGEDYKTFNPMLENGTFKILLSDANNKKVFLWGAGKACVLFIKQWASRLSINGIVDTDENKWSTQLCGYNVVSPTMLSDDDFQNALFIITSTQYMDDIALRLEQFGSHNYYGLAVLVYSLWYYKLFKKIADFFLWRILPVKNNRIVFSNGGRYGGNYKYIIDELLREKVPCEILWINPSSKSTYPEGVVKVPNSILSKIIARSTSKIWINNFKNEFWVKKRKGQVCINVWHGSIPIKTVDLDIDYTISEKYKKQIEFDSNTTDYRISNSENCSMMYRKSMNYTGEILLYGTPQMDRLWMPPTNIMVKLGIDTRKKLVLYAPTYRSEYGFGNIIKNTIELDFNRLKHSLRQRFESEFEVLYRKHPASKGLDKGELPEDVIDVSTWDDVYELLAETDILISDYSTLVTEMGSVNKIVLLFTPDYNNYLDDRGFRFKLEELPFPMATTNDELSNIIRHFNKNEYQKKLESFYENKIKIFEDGNASVRVVKKICDILDGNN